MVKRHTHTFCFSRIIVYCIPSMSDYYQALSGNSQRSHLIKKKPLPRAQLSGEDGFFFHTVKLKWE